MKIYTIENDHVNEGAFVSCITLRESGQKIPAITVGAKGENSRLGVLPVQLSPTLQREWEEAGNELTIHFAQLAQTRSGRNKLFATIDSRNTDEAIIVFRTTADPKKENIYTGDEKVEGGGYEPFPGIVLARGTISGDDENCPGGEQIVAIVPKNAIFRIAHIEKASDYFYELCRGKVIALSGEERAMVGIF